MIINDKGIMKLEVEQTPSSYRWLYQKDITEQTHNLGRRNYAPFVGFGIYTCIINEEGDIEILTKSYNQEIEDYKPLPPHKPYLWNFDKLPRSEYNNIKQLVEKKEWKTLTIKYHNKYGVSKNNYCCEMSDVQKNFEQYVNDNKEK